MDDERSRLSIEISKARSQISFDRPTPAFSNHKARSRSRTSLNRRPLPSPTSRQPRRATLPSDSPSQSQQSNDLGVADDPPASFQSAEGIPDSLRISDRAKKHSPVIERKPLPYHPLSHLGAGRFYDPSADRKRRHHRLRERASWSKLIARDSCPAWPPQATRDLLKEAGEWLDLVYPCPAPVEDGEVGSLQSPSSSGSFETFRGSELDDRLWTHGRGAVSLTSLVDDDKVSLPSACKDHGDLNVSKDNSNPGGDDTDKEFLSLPRKISMLRGEKIVVPSPPLLPSSRVSSATGEEQKLVTHDDLRESKVRQQLWMLQGLTSAEAIGGNGERHYEDHCLPDLAELDAIPATPKEDTLAEVLISPTAPSSEYDNDASDYDDEDEDSMSKQSPNERTPQRMPEYINLPMDLGDEQFSAAIAEALGFDRSPRGEQQIDNEVIADENGDIVEGEAQDSKTPVDACDLEMPLTESPLKTTSLDKPLPFQSSGTREQEQCEPEVDRPKRDAEISQPLTPVQEPSSSEITLAKALQNTAYAATSDEDPVINATVLPSSPKSEKTETIGVFSDLENLALASRRFASPPTQSSISNALRTPIPS